MKSLVERAKEAAKQQAEGNSGGNSFFNQAWKGKNGLPLYKPTVTPTDIGRVNLRVVPYEMTDPRNNPDCQDSGVLWYKRRFWVHNIGIEGVRVCCLSRTFGLPCPICRQRSKLVADGAPEEEVKKFNSKERELYNVYDYTTKSLRVLDCSTYCFGKRLLTEVNDPTNEGAGYYVSHDKDGMVLCCRFEPGTMKGVVLLGSVRFTPAKVGIEQEILDKAEDLDAILIQMSVEKINEFLDGGTAPSFDGRKEEAETAKPPATDERKEAAVARSTEKTATTVAPVHADDLEDLPF